MARELKYSSHETDFDALQRELSSSSSDDHREDKQDGEDDPYSDDGYDDYRR